MARGETPACVRESNLRGTARMQTTFTDEMIERASMDPVARGVIGLRIAMVNVYAVKAEDGSWSLIDAGLYFSAAKIRRWAARYFGEHSPPSAILLTHGHFDHVGALCELAEQWDVPVYAHPLEMPYITGRSKYPPPDPTVGRGAFSLLSFLYPRGPIDIGARARTLPEDGSVPGLPGWRWIHTPGHTAGHVSYFRESDRVLIAGDAFTTTQQESFTAVLSQRREFHGPPAYYTADWDAAQQSVERLAGLQPSIVACGHGLPVAGDDADEGLSVLARDFNLKERPVRGRYVPHPAVTDERGIVRLPPSPARPAFTALMVGAAVAAAFGGYALARRRR
jgi:glyoxylase-like metal-dependent hydrolase (beta-lactamase superfamily II)